MIRSNGFNLASVAIVVPVGPGDGSWKGLLPALTSLADPEIILVGTEVLTPEDHALLSATFGSAFSWLTSDPGRARQLNAGAMRATRPWLWFVHADSRFSASTLPSLANALDESPEALHYFDLSFLPDGPLGMRLTTIGVRLRSRVLGIPFGDQGFCMSRDTWERLGGFDERAAYGEDHLMVWRARQARVQVRATGGALLTSARRYRTHGWLRTTCRHLGLTLAQALPEWHKLLRMRLRNTP